MAAVWLALLGAAVAGAFGLLGVWLGVRWAATSNEELAERGARRRQVDTQYDDICDHLARVDDALSDLQSDVAGIAAVVRMIEPSLREPTRRHRSR